MAGRRHGEALMARALELGRRGLGRTFPNPAVGAVFVKNGRVLGEGYHRRAGGPHAEVNALRAAGGSARGATLYVTLEPCVHEGRTPPCTEALKPLGLRRVVIATRDPNPRVRGRGVRALRAAGIDVEVGLLRSEADALLAGYRCWITHRRPRATLKLATSLDGRIATGSGESKWITGAESRREAHRLRAACDAIVVGAGTVRADDPELTSRVRGGHNPVRVVVAGPTLDLPPRSRVFNGAAPTWVVTARGADARRTARLERRGVRVLEVASRRRTLAADGLVRRLGDEGLTQILVEGGGTLAGVMLRAGLVDELAWFTAPVVLGADARAAVEGLGIASLRDAARWRPIRVEQFGDDVLVVASPRVAR